MNNKATIIAGVMALSLMTTALGEAAVETASTSEKKPDQSRLAPDRESESPKGPTTFRAASSGETITWQVTPAGGTVSSSVDYRLRGTAGQTAVGNSSSATIGVRQGFWQDFGATTCCLGEIRGNADYDPEDQVDISDLIFLVEFMFNDGEALVCFEEANLVDDFVTAIDVADLVYLVDFLFLGGSPPPACP